MSVTNTTQNAAGNEEVVINLQDIWYLCLAKWKWFVLSLAVVLCIAVIYILTSPSVYIRSASLLIKEDSKGKSVTSDVSSMFADLGLSQVGTNVNNELIALQSPAVILEMIKRLQIDVDYKVSGTFHKETLYGAALPVKVAFPELADNENAELELDLKEDGSVTLSDFVASNEDRDVENGPDKIKGKVGDTFDTPLGKVTVTSATGYDTYFQNEGDPHIYVTRTNLYDKVDACTESLSVTLNDDKATVISLSYKDVSIQRAEDVLNMLISVYKENWVRDKNEIAISTTMFINDRLGILERELGDVDEDISSYKSKNLLPDVEAASNLYMTQSQQTNNRILELNTRLSMARYVRNYLSGNSNTNQLLPVNSGIESASIEKQISEYNTAQLQRNNLVANSSERNPLVVDLDQQLATMRSAILSSIDNLVVTLNTQIKELQKEDRRTTDQIAANPNQAKYLLAVGRQQKVKEALYLFLLQKREENELSQAFTAYNTRLITPPTGNLLPIAPRKKVILLVAFVIAVMIPAAIIFIREMLNTKVRGRKDLEGVSLPFIGEVPMWEQSKRMSPFMKWFNKVRGKKPEKTKRVIVVKEGRRDIINEAFRVVRTNLEFITGKGGTANVILITSFNAGSGKSFLAMNIAASLAVKKKKVLVIDGDLRHGTSSAYVGSPRRGMSDYLAQRIDHYEDLIVVDKEHGGLEVMPIGHIPPNPAELLEEPRFGQLVKDLRAKYDYILIDCPPIELVADTQIIEKQADRTIFVVRAGLLERSMLEELENIHREKKYKNMTLILNGTAGGGSRYHYGYRYGYHYGYGYGYHYTSNKPVDDEDEDDNKK
ncbi:MAG: polysaccharide biosynthesis tyrosine autokinase [Prevotellaceae bacterium]|nr:polysaccharide biosynthesis tyrosine autokinase [Prevotellaceae bacterium]